MPDKFTRTFAERLDRRSPLRVSEAQDLDGVGQGTVFVCPGRKCMELEAGGSGAERAARGAPRRRRIATCRAPIGCSRASARVAGRRAVGVILTGMGDDGVDGARAILQAGGTVIAESDTTAVVYGMPGSAVRAGVVSQSLPLPQIAEFLADLGD